MTVQVNVTVRADRAAMQGYIDRVLGGQVQSVGERVIDLAKQEITQAGRVGSGEMRDSGVAETQVRQSDITTRVTFQAAHSRFQHEGTANDGAGYIYPKRAKVLRFRGRGGGIVFAARVRGVKGVPFLTRALDRLSVSDFAD